MQVRWLFCTCKEAGCWCIRLVKVPYDPELTFARMGDVGPCAECFEDEHMSGEPPWYFKYLVNDQKEFIENEGVWHE